jgi:hypothetical protein
LVLLSASLTDIRTDGSTHFGHLSARSLLAGRSIVIGRFGSALASGAASLSLASNQIDKIDTYNLDVRFFDPNRT